MPTDSAPIRLDGVSNRVISGLRITNPNGHGIDIWNCTNITIEDCEILVTKGNGINGYGNTNVIMRRNKFKDNSSGCYLSTCTDVKFNNNECKNPRGPMPRGQMIQLNSCKGVIDVSCNISIVDDPTAKSEDQISILNCNGTAAVPIIVKNNYTKGGTSSTGTGIITGDGGGSYTDITDNVIINPGNIGIGVVGGTGHKILRNKIYGKASPNSNQGFVAYQAYSNIPCGAVEFRDNKIWYQKPDGSNACWWIPVGQCTVTQSGNVCMSTEVSENMPPPTCAGITPQPPNQLPVASAGADQIITLPTTTTTLNGSGSVDPDGSITKYLWEKISGAVVTIATPNAAVTNVSGLAQGLYTFRLTVTDNGGKIAIDEMQVVVKEAQTVPSKYITNVKTDLIVLDGNERIQVVLTWSDGSIETITKK